MSLDDPMLASRFTRSHGQGVRTHQFSTVNLKEFNPIDDFKSFLHYLFQARPGRVKAKSEGREACFEDVESVSY